MLNSKFKDFLFQIYEQLLSYLHNYSKKIFLDFLGFFVGKVKNQ